MADYIITSDRLSRKRGETFTDEELSGARIDALVEGGHLAKQHRSKSTEAAGDTATEKEQ